MFQLFIVLCFLFIPLFQVFIGHAEAISQVYFTPDDQTFISTGEAIFIWDFLGGDREIKKLELAVFSFQESIKFIKCHTIILSTIIQSSK